MQINVEELHAKWLAEMVSFSWHYLSIRHGPLPCRGAILGIVEGNEFIFETKGIFDLPPSSGTLILHMARFCRCTFGRPEAILGLDVEELPEPTFCLSSLLAAAFPRNILTGAFRGHDGGTAIGDLGDPHAAFRSAHVAFSGLGIIFMDKTRQILGPLAPDSEIVSLADGNFLTIID